jgi:rubrerythrin
MTNQIVQTEKQLVIGINKSFAKMECAKKGYVLSVIELGEKLNLAKELIPYGQWEKFLKAHSEFAFDERQAQKFMQISSNKTLVLEYFNHENSINGLTKAITDATPEQKEKAEQLKREQEEKDAINEQARIEKSLSEKLEKPSTVLTSIKIEPEIIEGVFEEVTKPVKAVIAEEIDPRDEAIDILQFDNLALQKEIESITKILDSSDRMSAALAKISTLENMVRVIQQSLRASQESENAAKRIAKSYKAKWEKLVKAVGHE